jgi:hypothetical protein
MVAENWMLIRTRLIAGAALVAATCSAALGCSKEPVPAATSEQGSSELVPPECSGDSIYLAPDPVPDLERRVAALKVGMAAKEVAAVLGRRPSAWGRLIEVNDGPLGGYHLQGTNMCAPDCPILGDGCCWAYDSGSEVGAGKWLLIFRDRKLERYFPDGGKLLMFWN